MSDAVLTSHSADKKPAGYPALLSAFKDAIRKALQDRDVEILRKAYDSFTLNTEHDKKSPMDQAFREILLYEFKEDVPKIGALIKLSVDAMEDEIASVTIPAVLLSDIFDAVTLEICERIFTFVEELVEVWKREVFFTPCKNNILRLCNDLLRRLSRSQNTIFCGRILLFLSKFFPFSERSGLNVVSEFNLENVTEYGVEGKDVDESFEDTCKDLPIKVDYSLYCKFWSIQDFFRNPVQCYSKTQWKMFQAHSTVIIQAFSDFKMDHVHVGRSSEVRSMDSLLSETTDDDRMDVDDKDTITEAEQSIRKSVHFFAKYLTNPRLMALQLKDPNFRRSVLIQYLILFQYLQQPVKFKTESNTLTLSQTEFIKESVAKVYRLLEEIPPNGKKFARTVQHMLVREEMWNSWKNDGCKEFKKPDDTNATATDVEATLTKPPSAKRSRRALGDCLREANQAGKFYLGNDVLTRLWNHAPDNLQACKSEERNFLPQLETYLDNPREKSDPAFGWRALRLLARQSPHFFTFVNLPTNNITEYLDNVHKKILKERADNGKQATSTVAAGNGPTEHNAVAEQEAVAIQDQEPDPELDEEEEPIELDKADDDQHASSKPIMTASREIIEEIAPLIGDDWKKLGKKLGYTADELLFWETEHPERDGACIHMLTEWFADDDDANLENWAYILEGLEINAASKAVKVLIENLSANKDNNSKTVDVELLSD